MEDIKLVYDDKGNICNDNFPDISGWKDLSQPEIDVKIKEDALNPLRDITIDYTNVNSVIWPEEPK